MELGAPIFLSHASEDEAETRKVETWLRALDLKPWASYNDINRLDYSKAISSAIANCGCLILLLSHNSIESAFVLKEINFAVEIGKKIFIYQLEDEVIIPQDILLMLGPVHKILSTKFPDDCLERLAKQLLSEAGVTESDARIKIKDALLAHKSRIAEAEREYKKNLQIWRDEYLDSRWQGGKFRDRPSKLDIETLNDRAKDLGIENKDIERVCGLSRDKDAKRIFTKLLNSALQHNLLNRQRLYTLEKKRIALLISRAEVKEALKRRTTVPKVTGKKNKLSSNSSPDIDWLVSLLQEAQTYSTSNPKKRIENLPHESDPNSGIPKYTTDHNVNNGDSRLKQGDTSNHKPVRLDNPSLVHDTSSQSIDPDLNCYTGESGSIEELEKLTQSSRSEVINLSRKLAKALAKDTNRLACLYDSSSEYRSLIAHRHNVDKNSAGNLVLLIHSYLGDETDPSILIALDFISVRDSTKSEPLHFDLIDSMSHRRIKSKYHIDSSGFTIIEFGYFSREGSTEWCTSISIPAKGFPPEKWKLLDWLILVCESAHKDFYLTTNFSLNAITSATQWIKNSDLDTLSLTASKGFGLLVDKEDYDKILSVNCKKKIETTVNYQNPQNGATGLPKKTDSSPDKNKNLQPTNKISENKSETDAVEIIFTTLVVFAAFGISKVCANIIWTIFKRGIGFH